MQGGEKSREARWQAHLDAASAAAKQLARRAHEVVCPPLLMACTPVPNRLPGLHRLLDPVLPRFFDPRKPEEGPLHCHWAEVEAVIRHYRWALPTSAEFEWALRGGVNTLFYWGDAAPPYFFPPHDEDEALAIEEICLPQIEATYLPLPRTPDEAPPPGHGRIASAWWGCSQCALGALPPRILRAGFPLAIRGGAERLLPWQNSGTWLLTLNAYELRASLAVEETRPENGHWWLGCAIRLA